MKKIHDFKIVRNKRLTPDYYVLVLKASEKLQDILPGQFVEVKVENSQNTFLRRPISINDVDYNNNTLSLLIRIAGEGTKTLSYLEENDFLNLVYPLGNTFTNPSNNKILLVGGGVGVAPLLYACRYYYAKGIVPTVLLGGRTKEDLLQIDEFSNFAKVLTITEDGTFGEKGLITEHSVFKNLSTDDFESIYTCGPEPMMKAIAKMAKEANVNCEVSLENTMACGVGACLCCVTETTTGNRCVCTEGPIFNINELKW